jgi:hypothetical protein
VQTGLQLFGVPYSLSANGKSAGERCLFINVVKTISLIKLYMALQSTTILDNKSFGPSWDLMHIFGSRSGYSTSRPSHHSFECFVSSSNVVNDMGIALKRAKLFDFHCHCCIHVIDKHCLEV